MSVSRHGLGHYAIKMGGKTVLCGAGKPHPRHAEHKPWSRKPPEKATPKACVNGPLFGKYREVPGVIGAGSRKKETWCKWCEWHVPEAVAAREEAQRKKAEAEKKSKADKDTRDRIMREPYFCTLPSREAELNKLQAQLKVPGGAEQKEL